LNTPFIHALAKWIGIALQAFAALWLLGWLQGNDPDCFLETGILLQLRMCDSAIVGDTQIFPAIYLAAMALIFMLGFLCMRWGTQSARSTETRQLPDA